MIVSSSVDTGLFTFRLGVSCSDAAVAHVLSVLSEGAVSENRCRENLLLVGESSLTLDFNVSGEWNRRGLENYRKSRVSIAKDM